MSRSLLPLFSDFKGAKAYAEHQDRAILPKREACLALQTPSKHLCHAAVGTPVPASMIQLGVAPMHAQCLGADRAWLYPAVQLNCKRLRVSRKHTTMSLNAGSWDTTGAQINGQTVAARIRRRVAIFVEPSPFSHVSGMKNRFECLIQGLRGSLPVCTVISCWFVRFSLIPAQFVAELGDDVTVVTPDVNPPKHYFGARVRRSNKWTCWGQTAWFLYQSHGSFTKI